MNRRVVVTGLGVVTSLSCQVEDLWEKLLAGHSGVHPVRLFDTTEFKVKFGGDVYDWPPVDYISPKDIKRIDRFTQIVGPDRVIAGSDCGFGTFAGFGAVDPDIAYAKLGALAEGAALASGRL